MDLNKNELKTEQLPDSAKVNYLNVLIEQVSNNKNKKTIFFFHMLFSFQTCFKFFFLLSK